MKTKIFGFSVIILLFASLVFTSCGSDDGEETNSVFFQTEADKELESRLINTKWVMTRIVDQNEDGQITYDSDKDEKWIQEFFSLYSEKISNPHNEYEHLCILHVNGRDINRTWSVFSDGLINLGSRALGKIISYTDSELIITTYKQTIFGDFYEKGSTWYFKRVDVDDEEEVVVNPEDLVGYWINYSNHDQEMTELGFEADGTCSYIYEYKPDNDRYKPEKEFAKGKYKINGNKLTMTLQFDDEKEIWEYTIISVSSSNLVLKDEDGEIEVFESFNDDVNKEEPSEEDPSEEVIDANKQDEIDAKDYRRGRVSGSFNGAGTAYSPYLISSAADLRLLSDECRNGNTFKGKYFKMTNDIVINRNVLNVNGELNNSNNFERWIPIGRYSKDYEYDFQGNFDGDGYTVSGIYINRPKLSHNGLFGSIEGTMKSYAVIKNLTVKDSYINCSSGALIAGSAGYTTIGNCYCYGYITGEYVAGISKGGTVERSDNYATVTGSHTACGICSRGTVFDCINYGNITGDDVGGIAYDGSQINNCINRGDIISNNGAAGGIRSCMKSGTVKNCVNLGKVYSKGHAGALVGAITNSGIVQNNHYLSSKQSIAVGYKYGQYTISNNNACSESEMKSEDVLSKLNSKRESGRCKWISGSDGYPTLDRK